MKKFEYKHIRLDYKGRGITQEINILDIDGERIRSWGSGTEVPTLPEIFSKLGSDGWEPFGIHHLRIKNINLSLA